MHKYALSGIRSKNLSAAEENDVLGNNNNKKDRLIDSVLS